MIQAFSPPSPPPHPSPFRSYNRHLKEIFGEKKIRKVTLHGGMTCPNLDGTKGWGGCTYCDNKGFSPAAAWRKISVPEQIESGWSALQKQGRCDGLIAYFQPFSNTYAKTDYLESRFREALRHPMVKGLAIGTRPDCLPNEVVELLSQIAKETYLSVEIGLQSAFDASLDRINRGHTFAEFEDAMRRCQNRGFEINVHVILGLPGETRTHWQTTASSLSRHTFDSLKIHPLHVVRGTEMAHQFQKGQFELPSRDEYVLGVVDFLERMPSHIALQRFTGDAPPDMLIGPDWCRDKAGLLRDILACFEMRKSHQGMLYHPTGSSISQT
jgi:uncharacterized protein